MLNISVTYAVIQVHDCLSTRWKNRDVIDVSIWIKKNTFCDSNHLQKSSEELDSLLEEYERIHNKSFYAVCANSVIRSQIGMANKEVDPFHVDYKIPSTEEDLTSRIAYTRLIT